MASRVLSTIVCVDGYQKGYTLCISDIGDVYSFGSLVEDDEGDNCLRLFPSVSNIQAISCGNNHTMFLDNVGNLFAFGNNEYGQLGIVGVVDCLHPQKIELPSIQQVSCGGNFTICLSDDGCLYSFGTNYYGQLGIGNNEKSYSSPQIIKSLENIDFVECGGDHVFCKTLNNDIYSWGNNRMGQLGIENTEDQNLPYKCENWPDNIVDIKCGAVHTLVLTENQEVYSCGFNYNGELGLVLFQDYSSSLKHIERISEIIRIECGEEYSMCIDIYNNVYIFGGNFQGQLGFGDYYRRRKPVKHPSLNDVIDVSKGGSHTFIKTSTNRVYAFGSNYYSQLGVKTEDKNEINPIQVFHENENIWYSNLQRGLRAKSARN